MRIVLAPGTASVINVPIRTTLDANILWGACTICTEIELRVWPELSTIFSRRFFSFPHVQHVELFDRYIMIIPPSASADVSEAFF